MPFTVLVGALVLGGMGLLLMLNTVAAANELRRHDLAAQDETVAAQVQELRNEVADSAAPQNLEQAAAALGMVPALNPAFLVVAPNGSVRVMGSPGPASPLPIATPVLHTATPTKPAATTPAKPPATPTSPAGAAAHGRHRPGTAPTSAAPTSTVPGRTPSATASPSPTPTPVLTLPGGDR